VKIPKEVRKVIDVEAEKTKKDFEEHGWPTGFKYSSQNCVIMESQKFNGSIKHKEDFYKHCSYAEFLYWLNPIDSKLWDLFPEVKKEKLRWIHDGICSYVSIVLYHLLLKDKVCTRGMIKYLQGYMVHNMGQENQVHRICHAWLNINGSMVDFTIPQIDYYGFKLKKSFIMGDIPDGLGVIGFVENEETIKKVTRKFAKEARMSIEEWINFHYDNSNNFMKNTQEIV
jgi:hypothetical protein